MAAVIRIKRHLNDDPLEAILLNCKRRKTEQCDIQSVEDLSAILKLAGTINNPDEDVFKHIKKPTKTETEDQYKKHTSDVIAKLRKQNQVASKNSRYKVINSFRSHDSTLQQDVETRDNCTVVDIETDENKENQEVANSNDTPSPQFVYDLYYTNSDDFGEADLNEFISVYPLSDGVIYGSQFDNGYRDSDSEHSEDSNEENNWRNDYPDESDMESQKDPDDDESISITEDDMLHAMHKVNLNGDDLSSDEYDEAFGYDRDEESGTRYARFKAKSSNEFCYYDEYDESCTP